MISNRLPIVAILVIAAVSCGKIEPIDTPVTPPVSPPETPAKVEFGVPTLFIDTEGGAAIESKTETVACKVELTPDADYRNPIVKTTGRIRGRGNATWYWYTDKRPYKLKLDESFGMCGMPANRDWTLLALHGDNSLMREAYETCLASKIDLPYQIRQEYVRVVLNGFSQGLYIICESVENAKHRIDVDKDGFIIEKDNHAELETVLFVSDIGHTFTFKYPDNGDIDNNDDNWKFIKDYVNKFEAAIYGKDFDDTEKGYRKYIEPKSFAKWYLLQEICNNYEPNPFYVMKNRGSLLEAGPTWDGEWSFGESFQDEKGWSQPPTQPSATTSIWSGRTYYRQLLQDDYFKYLVRKEWERLKPKIPEVHEEMAALAEKIKPAAYHNFKVYPTHLGNYPVEGLIKFDTWEEEVAYVDEYLDLHSEWFDKWIYEL